MRIAFMGTPDFALVALKKMVESGFKPVCVYTKEPRQKGRGHSVQKSAVHLYADDQGIDVRTPKSFKKDPDAVQDFIDLNLDVAIVAAYGLILPKSILDAPKHGGINIHGSILPRWRGAAPIHRAIESGDAQTGVTIMHMDEGLDTGDMIINGTFPIMPHDTGKTIHDKMAVQGGELIVQTLEALQKDGKLDATPQPDDGVTYAHKLEKEEGALDWSQSADFLERKIRAFTPWPGTWFEYEGQRFKVIEAKIDNQSGTVGEVLDDQLTVACSKGSLKITRLQRAGKSPMNTTDFLRGFDIPKGTVLAS